MRFLSYAAVSSDSILDEFTPHPHPTQQSSGRRDKSKPSAATVAALAEIDACGSIEEFKRIKGYMSAPAYWVFARCRWRRHGTTFAQPDQGTP
jgi:hypothetical protein